MVNYSILFFKLQCVALCTMRGLASFVSVMGLRLEIRVGQDRG